MMEEEISSRRKYLLNIHISIVEEHDSLQYQGIENIKFDWLRCICFDIRHLSFSVRKSIKSISPYGKKNV